MKIDQKTFDKLPQLDRIEFRQKEERIHKRYPYGATIWSCLMVTIFIIIILIMDLLFWIKLDKLILLPEMGLTLKLFMGVMILAFILDIYYLTMKSKKLEELQKEFFKLNSKKK